MRFGRLTVRGISRRYRDKGGCSVCMWHCICDCGGEIETRTNALWAGRTKSCGCFRTEVARAPKKHGRGKSTDPTYRVWQKIKERCHGTGHHRYSERGIKMCDLWRNDFAAFLADMGERPNQKHSIERIDNDGDYEPGNCRWATQREQMANVSYNRNITVGGETLHLTEWARRLGTSASAVFYRLQRGWTEEEAVTTPPIPAGKWLKRK